MDLDVYSRYRGRNGRTGRLVFLTCLVFLLTAAFVFSSVSLARAAQFSGSYLLHVCGVDENRKELAPGGHIACQSYIAGVLDYHNLLRSLGAAPSIDFCVPESTTLEELHIRVYSYIFKHRKEHGAFTAAPAVALALNQAYPCKQKKKATKK